MLANGVLEFRSANIAEIGHRFELVLPVTIDCPVLKGSVFETFKRTSMYLGEEEGIKVTSEKIRWHFGSKLELHVSSPIRRNQRRPES